MLPHRLAFVLSLAAGPAFAGSDVQRHQLTPSPEDNLVVGLCDGETAIEVKGVKPGDQITREQGQQIAAALMKEWRQKHPDAEWAVAAAESAIEAPAVRGVKFHHLTTVWLNGRAGSEIKVAATTGARPSHGGDATQNPFVSIAVRDHGEGVAREHLPRLTERFYRVDTARSREMGGTGLGLAIVKHILNRHRGFLDIESTPGTGSVFTVFLRPHPAATPGTLPERAVLPGD